jgi:hypothetical protein
MLVTFFKQQSKKATGESKQECCKPVLPSYSDDVRLLAVQKLLQGFNIVDLKVW